MPGRFWDAQCRIHAQKRRLGLGWSHSHYDRKGMWDQWGGGARWQRAKKALRSLSWG